MCDQNPIQYGFRTAECSSHRCYTFLPYRLMARDKFIPAKQLNLLAAGWIQFNLHDWFDHGPVDVSRRIRIELDEDDPVYNKHKGEMKIPRTKPDSCQMYSVKEQSVYHLRLWLLLNDS